MAKIFRLTGLGILIIIVIAFCCCQFTQQLSVAQTTSPSLQITNMETIDSSGQNCFYFCRGVNSVGFNVTVTNGESSIASCQLTITLLDNNRVPIEDFQSQVFSLTPDSAKTVEVFSEVVPQYAFDGIASAFVILDNASTGLEFGYSTINYYIGSTTVPSYVFEGVYVEPLNVSVVAGSYVNYTAIAYDGKGDSLDISYGMSWSIDPAAGGLWSGNLYSAAKAGAWEVTASIAGYTASAFITVSHGPPTDVTLSPSNGEITAGQSQLFNSTASDAYGNTWDVTKSTNFSIDSRAGGYWSSNTYNAIKAGNWTVTGIFETLTGKATLNVNHGPIVNLAVYPEDSNLTAGNTEAFNATAFDSYGNSWDITNSTVFTITSGAYGTWSSSAYTAYTAGTWTVTGSYLGYSNKASLTVTHSSPVQLIVNASAPYVTAGSSITYNATASDAYDNTWDVTSAATWSINGTAGGYWSSNTYFPSRTGNWVVTAMYRQIQEKVPLSVYSPIDFYHTGTVNFDDIIYFVSAYIIFYQTGVLNPACDLNHDGTLNFSDILLLVQYYTAATNENA